MKPYLLLWGLLFPFLAFVQPVQKGDFYPVFDKAAAKLNETNAYLLGYLAYLSYPKYLYDYRKSQEMHLTPSEWYEMDNDAYYFLAQFRKHTKPFFGELSAQHYAFFAASHKKYDPEAILVDDSTCIWLIFRGTDSVMTQEKPFLKHYQEWLSTDFDIRKTHIDALGSGRIHSGFSKSLLLIADSMANAVVQRGGKNKKIWICGHSLGGAQAILFAMYLYKNYGIKAQGVYVYACPPVGNKRFAKEINRVFAHNELQRFEFVDDPVTMLPPQFLGFRHAGHRHYFDGLNKVSYNMPERKAYLGNRNLLLFPMHISSVLFKQALHKPQLKMPVGGLCFHHPEWYIQALYRPSVAQKLPKLQPMTLPNESSMGCNCDKVARATGESQKVFSAK